LALHRNVWGHFYFSVLDGLGNGRMKKGLDKGWKM